MASEWRSMKLGDFVTLQRGHDLPDAERKPGTVPVIGSFGVTGYHDTPKAKGPGVTVGRSGASFGVVTYSPVDFWPHNACLYVIDFHGNDERFAYYFLKSLDFSGFNSGSAQPSLNRNFIHPIPVTIPPLPEQRAIAHILGVLDDKIELNRRMNATLESMARALFKQWFVDEAEEGWEVKPLDEIANYLNGLALQKFPPKDGEESLPVIKIAQLRKNSTEGADRASANIDPAYIVNDGDVLFSWSGSLEVSLWCGGRGALNQHLFKVTSEHYPKWFYYLWTREHLPDFQEIAAGKATTMGHIQRHHLKVALAIVPPALTMNWMTAQMSPLIDRFILNMLQSRTLAALRDAPLPKLISGEMRVGSVEAEFAGVKRSPGEEARAKAYRRMLRPNDRYRRR